MTLTAGKEANAWLIVRGKNDASIMVLCSIAEAKKYEHLLFSEAIQLNRVRLNGQFLLIAKMRKLSTSFNVYEKIVGL